MKGGRIITLDGPAASGKSSVARQVAERLGVPFVSSGMLYRAAALLTLERGVSPDREEGVLELLEAHRVRLEPTTDGNRVRIDGRDATRRLHTDEVDRAVSRVARHPRVRAWVNARLREIAGPFVIEGRDMGTVVFPDAGAKFFLTAPAEVRARRRVGERSAELEEVAEAIRLRDEQDRTQSRPAEDALHIDTGAMTLEEVVERVVGALAE